MKTTTTTTTPDGVKVKPTHGGARKGAGRWKTRADKRRVWFSATVSPETDARLNAVAERMGVSLGRALDALLAPKLK